MTASRRFCVTSEKHRRSRTWSLNAALQAAHEARGTVEEAHEHPPKGSRFLAHSKPKRDASRTFQLAQPLPPPGALAGPCSTARSSASDPRARCTRSGTGLPGSPAHARHNARTRSVVALGRVLLQAAHEPGRPVAEAQDNPPGSQFLAYYKPKRGVSRTFLLPQPLRPPGALAGPWSTARCSASDPLLMAAQERRLNCTGFTGESMT